MHIVLGGTRGTCPIAHADCMRYGGATTCVLVEDHTGTRIILDAGTGLRNLPADTLKEGADEPALLLLTHYHLDHLIGLPAFGPLYDASRRIRIAAPEREGVTAEAAVQRLMEKPFWPVRFGASCEYLVLPESAPSTPWRHGAFEVRWCAVHHRNGCHAYRIDSRLNAASVVFATDLEWLASNDEEREAFLRLCQAPSPVDLLIMDGQFDAADHARYSGWGHSTWQDTVEVAEAVGAGQLVVTHHAPDSTDAVLDRRADKLRNVCSRSLLAHDGLHLNIGENHD